MSKRKKRVLLGMSGGVDSSVAAYLLKKQGYDVIGITMQLLPKDDEKVSNCCNLGAIGDAKRVAAKLNIPHYTINSRDVFKEKVIDHFTQNYLAGYTPNPCVECNRHIKFDEMERKAKDMGADYIATGHYVKRTRSPKTGKYFLRCANDQGKDQSYFLYMMPQAQLAKTLFPLGRYEKDEIREIARALDLINADKPDSQEICFVPKSYKDYIKKNVDAADIKGGDIVNMEGAVLGKHDGVYQYTIGQRKGLSLGTHEPMYVIKIDGVKNQVVVGNKDILKRNELSLLQFTLINPDFEILGKTVEIKVRYQMAMINAVVTSHDGARATLELKTPHSFIASGQSCVLYKGDLVLGGGIIEGKAV